MKQHHNTKWLSSLYRGMLLSASLLLVSGMAMAQLSGSYTINSASATSGTNFKSFADLTSALSSNGVKGAVVVDVVKGSGPYSEAVTLPAASGASASNTITINGNGETVVNTSSSAVFTFDGADYYTLSDLIIDAQGTGTGTRCIHIWKQANYNTVKGCELIMSKYTGTSNSTGYVVFSNSTTGNSAALHGSYNKIDNNKMWNGSTSKTTGPYYGVCEYGSSAYYTTTGANEVTNNDVQNVYYYTMYFYYCNGYKIENNKIHNNRTYTYAYVTYCYYGRTTTDQISISGNDIYDLTGSYIYLYAYQCQGTSAMPIKIDDNKVHDNAVDYYLYNYWGYYATELSVQRNKFYNNSVGYYLYNIYMGYYSTNLVMRDNEVYNNTAGYYVYGICAYYATNALVERNSVHDNDAGYGVYGFYIYYMSGTFRNNTYYNNTGDYYNYGMLGGYTQTNLDITHNTFVMNDDVDYYNYGLYAYMYYAFNEVNVKNNIVVLTGNCGASYYNYVVYMPYNYKDMNIENNDFYVNNTSANNYFYTNGQNATLAAFATSIGNQTNIEVDPKFTDLAKGNIIPTNPVIANYGQPGYADEDFAKTKRTACGPDLGAFEFYNDHNASNLVFSGVKECGGYTEPIKFTFNNGSTVDLEDARVYYTINKGTAAEVRVDETIDLVKASSSFAYTFTAVPEFHEPGVNTIEVGLACDDNTSNNVLTTTITITPAPHSFELSEGANFPGYFNKGIAINNPDVTVPGKQIEYNINNPSKYTNGAYGTDWTAVATAMTQGGVDVTSDLSFTSPGAAKGIVAFDPSASLEDSTVAICVTVTDNNTGCDSTFCRWVYVPATPQVDWVGKDGCDGDVVAFVNNTTQSKGATEYTWDFGDPNSGTENNMSTISDPVHKFSTYGDYTVTMTAWNFDYPKFTYTKTAQVSISPVPTVAYRVNNACFGDAITFVNMTTLPSGITGTVDYTWNFGNGATSKKKDESYKYPAPGGYKVTLTASLKGCATSLTKNANQFAKPVADFLSIWKM